MLTRSAFQSAALCMVIAIAGAGLPPEALAAESIDLLHARGAIVAANQSIAAASTVSPDADDIGALVGTSMGLGADEQLGLLRVSGDGQVRHFHYQQFYRGVPIWNERIVVSVADDRVVRLGGTLIRNLGSDLPNTNASLSAEDALARARTIFLRKPMNQGASSRIDHPVFSQMRSRPVIYIRPADRVARLSYEVSFFVILNARTGEPARPYILIDAKNGEILLRYDGLTFADGTGPGGNQKTGQYRYGPGAQRPPLEVTALGRNKCALSNASLRTENLNEGVTDIGSPFGFKCFENTVKPINGAFSPLNDAHYFGSIIFAMWTNWYGTAPVARGLVFRVHYGRKYANAYWSGLAMYFGDGDDTHYPTVALDIASHEVAHGYTQEHSGLSFNDQSGAINEAFSDMAGETAEFYAAPDALPDFLVGPTILKQPGAFLRNMCDPPSDGQSIASARDFRSGMNPHQASGVYNKAFCLLAKTAGWDPRKAFHVFQIANRDYWTPSTNFQSGAEAVRDAAIAKGYPPGDVISAFAAVDIVVHAAADKN
jgi:vibriolysin